VFKAYTNPNHIPEWWGPENLTTVVESMELKVGGVWRFIQKDSAGKEYAFSGVYHEIVFPSRLVFSFVCLYLTIVIGFISLGME
jgi:uncharacterized protein YndB with AHSA1/START domain